MGCSIEDGGTMWIEKYGIDAKLQFLIDNGLGPEDMEGQITINEAQRG